MKIVLYFHGSYLVVLSLDNKLEEYIWSYD